MKSRRDLGEHALALDALRHAVEAFRVEVKALGKRGIDLTPDAREWLDKIIASIRRSGPARKRYHRDDVAVLAAAYYVAERRSGATALEARTAVAAKLDIDDDECEPDGTTAKIVQRGSRIVRAKGKQPRR